MCNTDLDNVECVECGFTLANCICNIEDELNETDDQEFY